MRQKGRGEKKKRKEEKQTTHVQMSRSCDKTPKDIFFRHGLYLALVPTPNFVECKNLHKYSSVTKQFFFVVALHCFLSLQLPLTASPELRISLFALHLKFIFLRFIFARLDFKGRSWSRENLIVTLTLSFMKLSCTHTHMHIHLPTPILIHLFSQGAA